MNKKFLKEKEALLCPFLIYQYASIFKLQKYYQQCEKNMLCDIYES